MTSQNAKDEKPLTQPQRAIYIKTFTSEMSRTEKDITDRNEIVGVDMLINEKGEVVHNKPQSVKCSRRYRKSEVVIVSIAVIFIIILLSFVAVSFHMNVTTSKTQIDLTKTTMLVTTALSRTPTTASGLQNSTMKESEATTSMYFTTSRIFHSATSLSPHTSHNTSYFRENIIPTTEKSADDFIASTAKAPTLSTRITTTFTQHLLSTIKYMSDNSTPVITKPPQVLETSKYISETRLTTSQHNFTRLNTSTTYATSTSAFHENSTPRLSVSVENKITLASNEKIVENSANFFFVDGPFSYEEARLACASEESLLALKGDIQKAWENGYKRDDNGWLRDLHVAMMRKNKNGKVTYKPSQDPDIKQTGAYCVPSKYEEVNSHFPIGSNPNRTINWWSTNDAADVYDLRHILMSVTSEDDEVKYPLLASLKSIYTCCNAFNITTTAGDNPIPYVKKRYADSIYRKVIQIYRREMRHVKVLTHVSVKYDAMIKYEAATTYRTQIVSSLVNMVKDVGLDGIILDYEPKKEYTREHAAIYRTFLNELSDKMRKNELSVGTVVSSWGILKHYDIIGSSGVDFIGSMSSTYYGHNIENNKKHVTEMLKYIKPNRLEIGLGLMHKSTKALTSRRNFRWNEKNLVNFLTWSKHEGVSRIHTYSSKWKSHKTTEKFYVESLAAFTKG